MIFRLFFSFGVITKQTVFISLHTLIYFELPHIHISIVINQKTVEAETFAETFADLHKS